VSQRVTSGRYEGYVMIPADHIKAAEDLLVRAEAATAKGVGGATLLTSMAAVHVAIAQAQMQGQGRA